MTLDDITGSWSIRGSGKRACFSAWSNNGVRGVGYRMARVLVKRKPDEPVDAMIARGLKVLAHRLEHGVKKATPKSAERLARERTQKAFNELSGGKVH